MAKKEEKHQSLYFERDLSEEAVRERYYLWVARTFALVLVVSILTSLMLLTSLQSLLPIIRVQPFHLKTLNKEEQVVDISRPNLANIRVNELTESFIRSYLLAYFSVGTNINELEQRWSPEGDVQAMSETSVFAEFTKNADKWLRQAKEEGFTRNVNILVANPYQNTAQGNLWRVELEFVEMRHGSTEPKKSKLTVLIKVGFKAQQTGIPWESRLKNPLGFFVQNLGRELNKNE